MIKKIVLGILTLTLISCAKTANEVERDAKIEANRIAQITVGKNDFAFQVIQSPVTGKCYESVHRPGYALGTRFFEISCDYKK